MKFTKFETRHNLSLDPTVPMVLIDFFLFASHAITSAQCQRSPRRSLKQNVRDPALADALAQGVRASARGTESIILLSFAQDKQGQGLKSVTPIHTQCYNGLRNLRFGHAGLG